MKETSDSFPPLHTGSFLTKEQAEQFKEAFKNLTVVVRCKDCKWNNGFTGCDKYLLPHGGDWFCADGERK